jgi:hypothetical protein
VPCRNNLIQLIELSLAVGGMVALEGLAKVWLSLPA